MARILVVTASAGADQARLQLGVEARNIAGALSRRTNFEVIHALDATCGSLIDALAEERPDVLHFAGHGIDVGQAEAAIQLVDNSGKPQILVGATIKELIQRIRCPPRLVFLNCCYSASLAAELGDYVDVVIGVQGRVSDSIARTFSACFYQRLGESRSVADSFALARIATDPTGQMQDQFILSYAREGGAELCFPGSAMLEAEFLMEEGGRKPVCVRGKFELELSLRNVDPRVDSVVYQLCHDSYRDIDEEFWEVQRSQGSKFVLEEVTLYGDFNVRVTAWTGATGVGFDCSIGDALERRYPRNSRVPEIDDAIQAIQRH